MDENKPITIELRPGNIKIAQMALQDEVRTGTIYSGWSLEAYCNRLFELGADMRKRSIEATEKRRQAEEAQRNLAAGIEKFSLELLRNPQKYQTLEQLLGLGAQFAVPAQMVLEYYQNRQKVQSVQRTA